jgi:hypothetical protein
MNKPLRPLARLQLSLFKRSSWYKAGCMNTWERSQVMCDEEHKIPWEIASQLAVVRDNTVHRQQTPSTLSLGWGCFFSAS